MAIVALTLAAADSQQSQPSKTKDSIQTREPGGMGGISSAGTFAPVYDERKRPITAGGFVDKGTIVFEDATKASGLGTWQHVMGTKQKKYILETDGSGVGLIDYDNDGWLDIYLVNGSTYDALSGKRLRRMPHSSITITTARSLTSLQKPVSPTNAGASA